VKTRWTDHFSKAPELHSRMLLPILFDPRTKRQPFSFLPQRLQDKGKALADFELSKVCDEPSSQSPTSPSPTQQAAGDSSSSSFWAQSEPIASEEQLNLYLQMPDCSNKDDPAVWFRTHSSFSHVYQLFREWCGAPAAATSVERLWSQATFLDDRLRARMDPDLLSARLFVQKNRQPCSLLTGSVSSGSPA